MNPMRSLLVFPFLALALAACAGSRPPPPASSGASWRPAVGTAAIECRWDDEADAQPGPALEAACQKDAACGCARLGHALLMASAGAVDARALEVLDGACHHGVAVSCSEASMVEELCVRGTARPSPACDVLEHQGRLGSAEMQGRGRE